MAPGETWKAIGQFIGAHINEHCQRAGEKQRQDTALHAIGWPHFTEVLLGKEEEEEEEQEQHEEDGETRGSKVKNRRGDAAQKEKKHLRKNSKHEYIIWKTE